MITENLTFEQLPEAVKLLTKEVSQLKSLLLEKREQQPTEQPEQFLSIQEASKFLNLSVPTIYSKVNRKELPCMKRGKRLYFSDRELTQYLKDGKRKSNDELEAEAKDYLKKKGGLNA